MTVQDRILTMLKTLRKEDDWEVKERPSRNADGTYNFSITSTSDVTLTFSDLDKMSEAFATNMIDFAGETRETGYCSSCYGTSPGLVLAFKKAMVS